MHGRLWDCIINMASVIAHCSWLAPINFAKTNRHQMKMQYLQGMLAWSRLRTANCPNGDTAMAEAMNYGLKR